jgi:hypothetical protein
VCRIFNEYTVEDEYDPMKPNDYAQCMMRKEAEKRMQKAIEAAKKVEDMEKYGGIFLKFYYEFRKREEHDRRATEEDERREDKRRTSRLLNELS